MCDGAELGMKLLVGWRDQLAVGTRHRSAHRACKIRNGARPFAPQKQGAVAMSLSTIIVAGCKRTIASPTQVAARDHLIGEA